ncbi:MAG: FAD-dependent oxidoreductase, partial [Coriobacteriales bacterium]|nr:FAD-dependent oxidoreductase [Coriobacteriales bacterium]
MKQTSISRRSLVTGAAAVAACAAVAGIAQANEQQIPQSWDMEADIVVIGSGGAGMAAACKAREAGASVLVLEKLGATGGDTALSGQTSIGPWPAYEAELGVEDSIELYLEEQANSYKWGAFAEKGREFPAEHPFTELQSELHAEMMEWTRDTVGVGWTLGSAPTDPNTEGVLPQPTWNSVSTRSFMAMDPANSVMAAFNAYAKNIGVDIRMRTEADRLITNEAGRVIGVWAYDENDEAIAVKAAKAVIVATGGFSANRGMMERYLPITKGILGGGSYGVTGDGIRMVRQVGGTISEMDLGCHWYPFEAGTNSGQYSTTLVLFGGYGGVVPISQQPGVMLNYEGKRFV